MIASLIGLGVSLAAGGWKAAQERKANKRYKAERDREFAQNKAETNAFYSKQFYENPLTRADNAALLNHMQQKMKEQTDRATATAAISGATPEAIQAQKNAMSDAYAQTVSDIAASNQQHKDQVANAWQDAKQAIRSEFNTNMLEDYKTKMGNINKFGELSQKLGESSLTSLAGGMTRNAPRDTTNDQSLDKMQGTGASSVFASGTNSVVNKPTKRNSLGLYTR